MEHSYLKLRSNRFLGGIHYLSGDLCVALLAGKLFNIALNFAAYKAGNPLQLIGRLRETQETSDRVKDLEPAIGH